VKLPVPNIDELRTPASLPGEESIPDMSRVLVAAFEQNWENARHIKNERLTFTNMFSAIAAGVLSFLHSMSGSHRAEIYVLLFLCFFSVMGLLTSLRLKAELEECIQTLERLAGRLGVTPFTAFGQSTGALRRYPKFRWLFPIYYAVAGIGFFSLLVSRIWLGAIGK
jgi:hypothetical protein